EAIKMVWNFPSYAHFDYTYTAKLQGPMTYIPVNGAAAGLTYGQPIYGELTGAATAAEKTIGYTWSDPAVGQIKNENSPFVALTGSGFYPSQLQTLVRGGVNVGTTAYMFNMGTGALLFSKSDGNDVIKETQDDCTLGAYQIGI